jgi:hypothetical protein
MKRQLATLLISVLACTYTGSLMCGEVVATDAPSAQPGWNFEKALEEYSKAAKEISKRQISPEDEAKLVGMFTAILDAMKKQLNVEKVEMQHIEGAQNSGILVQFIIAIHKIYGILTPELIAAIVKKSPLELVSLLREIYTFLRFVTANPRDYGRGNFTERDKQSGTITVMATDINNLNGIIQPIALETLFVKAPGVYKLSRLTTAIIKQLSSGQQPTQDMNGAVDSMKRNTADDSRIPIVAPTVQVSG